MSRQGHVFSVAKFLLSRGPHGADPVTCHDCERHLPVCWITFSSRNYASEAEEAH